MLDASCKLHSALFTPAYIYITLRSESFPGTPRDAYRGGNFLGGFLVHMLLLDQVAGEITHSSHLVLRLIAINLSAQKCNSEGKADVSPLLETLRHPLRYP